MSAARSPSTTSETVRRCPVRRALTLAIDAGAARRPCRKSPSCRRRRIAYPLAASGDPRELEKIAGYWPISRSRGRGAAAAEGGRAEGLAFELLNRNVDQPYKYVAPG